MVHGIKQDPSEDLKFIIGYTPDPIIHARRKSLPKFSGVFCNARSTRASEVRNEANARRYKDLNRSMEDFSSSKYSQNKMPISKIVQYLKQNNPESQSRTSNYKSSSLEGSPRAISDHVSRCSNSKSVLKILPKVNNK